MARNIAFPYDYGPLLGHRAFVGGTMAIMFVVSISAGPWGLPTFQVECGETIGDHLSMPMVDLYRAYKIDPTETRSPDPRDSNKSGFIHLDIQSIQGLNQRHKSIKAKRSNRSAADTCDYFIYIY